MVSLFEFVVRPEGGKISVNKNSHGLILSSSIDNHKNSNRFGIVESVPLGYSGPIKNGDEVVVHHNVFRKYNDMRGKEKFSSSKIRGDKYLASDLEVYAFKSDGEWESIEPYIFLSADGVHNGEVLIQYDGLESKGISRGDRVFYKPDSEYEFVIDGVKMYRVPFSNICGT